MAQKTVVQYACSTKAKESSKSSTKKLACEMMADGQKSYGQYVRLSQELKRLFSAYDNQRKSLEDWSGPSS
jgi:hypothetical protein